MYHNSSKITCVTRVFGGGQLSPKIEVSKPTNGHVWLTDGDSSIVILWFDRDCLPKMLIDEDDLSDSDDSGDDYEDDFTINEKYALQFVKAKSIFYQVNTKYRHNLETIKLLK